MIGQTRFKYATQLNATLTNCAQTYHHNKQPGRAQRGHAQGLACGIYRRAIREDGKFVACRNLCALPISNGGSDSDLRALQGSDPANPEDKRR